MLLNTNINFILDLTSIVFMMGLIGILLNRKNILIIIMSIELLLLAINLNFAAFSIYLDDNDIIGQIFVIFVLVVITLVSFKNGGKRVTTKREYIARKLPSLYNKYLRVLKFKVLITNVDYDNDSYYYTVDDPFDFNGYNKVVGDLIKELERNSTHDIVIYYLLYGPKLWIIYDWHTASIKKSIDSESLGKICIAFMREFEVELNKPIVNYYR